MSTGQSSSSASGTRRLLRRAPERFDQESRSQNGGYKPRHPNIPANTKQGTGQQPVHGGLHSRITGSEGDRQGGVLHNVPERDQPGLGECRYNRRTRPRTRDDQLNDHHGHAGHRAAGWQRRIGGFLGGRGGPLPAGCTGHVKDGRSDPGGLHPGVGDARQRNDSNKATEAALAAYLGGVVDRVVELSNGRYEVHYIGVNWPHHIFVNQDFKVIGAND